MTVETIVKGQEATRGKRKKKKKGKLRKKIRIRVFFGLNYQATLGSIAPTGVEKWTATKYL